MDGFKLVEELKVSAKALEAYHLQVATNYKEIVTHLETMSNNTTQLTSKDTNELVNLITLPLTDIFQKMDRDKPGSPEYIYRLVQHAYNSYKT